MPPKRGIPRVPRSRSATTQLGPHPESDPGTDNDEQGCLCPAGPGCTVACVLCRGRGEVAPFQTPEEAGPQPTLSPDDGETDVVRASRAAAARADAAVAALKSGSSSNIITCCYNPTCTADSAPKRCSKCKMVRYCSRDCQVSHWPQHKPVCGAFRACQKLCDLFAQDSDYNKTVSDLQTKFEEGDAERHCVGIVCHTVDKVKEMCVKAKLFGGGVKVDIKNFTLRELRTAAAHSMNTASTQCGGDAQQQLLDRNWQRVVSHTEQYKMGSEVSVFVHTDIDDDGGSVLVPVKVAIMAGPAQV
eukprot:COSAG05_NODE_2835_length_2585_cov_2.664521_2_plen_302_part_00